MGFITILGEYFWNFFKASNSRKYKEGPHLPQYIPEKQSTLTVLQMNHGNMRPVSADDGGYSILPKNSRPVLFMLWSHPADIAKHLKIPWPNCRVTKTVRGRDVLSGIMGLVQFSAHQICEILPLSRTRGETTKTHAEGVLFWHSSPSRGRLVQGWYCWCFRNPKDTQRPNELDGAKETCPK